MKKTTIHNVYIEFDENGKVKVKKMSTPQVWFINFNPHIAVMELPNNLLISSFTSFACTYTQILLNDLNNPYRNNIITEIDSFKNDIKPVVSMDLINWADENDSNCDWLHFYMESMVRELNFRYLDTLNNLGTKTLSLYRKILTIVNNGWDNRQPFDMDSMTLPPLQNMPSCDIHENVSYSYIHWAKGEINPSTTKIDESTPPWVVEAVQSVTNT